MEGDTLIITLIDHKCKHTLVHEISKDLAVELMVDTLDDFGVKNLDTELKRF